MEVSAGVIETAADEAGKVNLVDVAAAADRIYTAAEPNQAWALTTLAEAYAWPETDFVPILPQWENTRTGSCLAWWPQE